MKILRHLLKSPFVAATGAAAFVHSTWTIATIFGGLPPIEPFNLFTWLAWAMPAMLIAFALDIGQINTSIEIAEGQRTKRKYLAFALFALFTYFLQWFHLIHHIPALPLSQGVVDSVPVQILKAAAVWIMPALLPASTLLYTLSHSPAPAPEVQPDENFLHMPVIANGKNARTRSNGTVKIAESSSPGNPDSHENSARPGAE